MEKLGAYINFFKNLNAEMETLVSSNLMQQLITSLRLITVFICFVIVGWLLNGFDASQIVWLVTLAVCCYLAWVGSGGIALASVWVVGLMSMAAIGQFWPRNLPRPEFQFIPMALLANWLFALSVVWQLGKISDLLRQGHLTRIWAFSLLLSVAVLGLLFGWQLYPESLLFISNF
jgi:hypothetical protein